MARRPMLIVGAWLAKVVSLLLTAGLINAAAALTLDEISFVSLPGEKVQVKLGLSGPASEPLSFAVDNPARLALDLPGVELNIPRQSQAIGVGMARSITAVEAGGRTRVVLNLIKLIPYEMRVEGQNIYIILEGVAAAQGMAFSGGGKSAAGSVHQIENIDFRRGESGEARVIVTLSDPNIVIDSREEGGKLIVDFMNVSLPERLERTLDVMDFATPVSIVDTFAQNSGVRMIVNTTNDLYEQLAYQSDNLFTLEVKPLTKEEAAAVKKTKGYTGERLSLNFQDIEVRAILQLLADFTGFNLVASDSVGGNLTLRLKNVPSDQAMEIILRARGLGMRKSGNVVMVAPSEELAAREKLELEAAQQVEELSPLRTEFVQVNYAKAADIAGLLKAKENSLLSERGNVTTDDRTNTLLVRDTADNLDMVRKMIATLDIPVRQVLIESRIVIADDNFTKDIGVKFGYSHNSINNGLFNDPDNFAWAGGREPGDVVSEPWGTGAGGAAPFAFGTDGMENYLVDLPAAATGGSLGLAIGKIGTWLLQLELSAMQVEGRGEVISNPRVITANQHEARIEQGTEIPYQEASSSGATSVSFKKAVISLAVTPQITPDDNIIMDLNVTKDSVGTVYGGIPSIDTKQVSTQVLVRNGETVVLGGVYEQTTRDDVRRVPFFSDLPFVGFLFKNSAVRNEKNELLVFVTPKIIKEELAVR
ncbi:MAG: type IV pilus secretin PilQ [Gammaproteobacteria bacterium]|nr:type IV pilus secretin PilQ [Gammaproteobacteria bacterium]